MKLLKVNKSYRYLDELKRIYEEALPANERVPFDELMCADDGIVRELFAIIDDASPKGFMHVRKKGNIVYIIYFGIDKLYRNMGKGSRAIKLMCDYYKDAVKVLCVERPTKDNDIRARRIRFYKRNGFSLADFEFDCVGDKYYVMYNGAFDKKEFIDFLLVCFPGCTNFKDVDAL